MQRAGPAHLGGAFGERRFVAGQQIEAPQVKNSAERVSEGLHFANHFSEILRAARVQLIATRSVRFVILSREDENARFAALLEPMRNLLSKTTAVRKDQPGTIRARCGCLTRR